MQRIFTLVVALAVVSASFTPQDSEQFIMGLFEGALNEAGLGDISSCTYDVDKLFNDVDNAVNAFHSHSFNGIKNGVSDLANALKDIAGAVHDCKKIGQDDINKLKSMVDMFGHPWKLVWDMGKHLFLDGIDIWKHIWNGITSWGGQNYNDSGRNFGYALSKLFFGAPERGMRKSDNDAYLYDSIDNFAAVFGTVDDQAVYNSVNKLGDHFAAGVMAFVKNEAPSTASHAKLFVNIVSAYFEDACENLEAVFEPATLKAMKDALSCGKNVKVGAFNHAVRAQTMTSMTDLMNEDFEAFGTDFAHTLTMLC